MMKLILVFSLLTNAAFAGISVVSDLDDTIKISHSASKKDSFWNGFFTRNVFTGMPNFLSRLSEYTNGFYVVTGSKAIMAKNVWKLFKKHDIKIDHLYMRSTFKKQNIFDFKVSVIKKILEKSPDDFIFIGDDVGQDPTVYEHIRSLYPNRVLAIYIHRVTKKKLGDNLIPYYTAFDLALREVLSGRMNPEAIQELYYDIHRETNYKNAFPSWAHCPKEVEEWAWSWTTPYHEYSQYLAGKIVRFCTPKKKPGARGPGF